MVWSEQFSCTVMQRTCVCTVLYSMQKKVIVYMPARFIAKFKALLDNTSAKNTSTGVCMYLLQASKKQLIKELEYLLKWCRKEGSKLLHRKLCTFWNLFLIKNAASSIRRFPLRKNKNKYTCVLLYYRNKSKVTFNGSSQTFCQNSIINCSCSPTQEA